MSRYDWPKGARSGIHGDDPGERGRFVRRIRTDFDSDGARAASLAPPRPAHPHPGGAPFAPASGRANLWQPIGPVTVLGGQATGGPRVSGRINMLAVHSGGQRVYAASANGGVWYSNNGGVSWKSLGGFAVTATGEIVRPVQRHTCGSIAVKFGNTEATDVVYVGTGETTHQNDAQPGHSLGGIGILVADHPATTGGDNPWTREAKNLLGTGVCRIAVQPTGAGVVAATTNGLFQRPSPGADNEWTKVAGIPFSTLTDKCSDVLWTKGEGPRPERLWVWVEDGASAGLWCRDGGATDFTPIVTAGSVNDRAVMAAAEPQDQIFLFHNRGDSTAPILFRIASASAATPVATEVKSVPNVVKTQGFYDIAVAVHPANKDRVAVGGALDDVTTPDGTLLQNDAAVFVGDIGLTGPNLTFGQPSPALPSTMIGVGVHADVHDLVYSNNGDRLWLACDGGVFRSDQPTKQVGFFPVNDGLSISEANYVANHPTCEGYVVAGLQDNGVIGRRSSGVWKVEGLGDGGGVAFDPLNPQRYVRQYVKDIWYASDSSIGALPFQGETAAFYSMPAATGHRRGVVAPAAPDVGQLIVGTSRVWYTEDFGATWRTLPTGSTPPPGGPQDPFGEKITVCRWQSPDVAWILGQTSLKRYVRAPGSDAGGGPGTWTVDLIPLTGVKTKKPKDGPADAPIRQAAIWTDVAVNLDAPPGPGQAPVPHGTKGAVYLGTIGNPANDNVDTLWWFDGESTWHSTNLRKQATGVPAPVTSIVCDPEHPDEVWVGTTVGVWHGLRTLHDSDPPTWVWSSRVNGLPEAAVEDLAIFSDGGLRLLRAGIAARGVWELRLDVTDLTDVTYVRAHDDDLRYRARAVEKQRDLVTDRSWHGSPDVRPRRAPVSVPAPASLFWAIGSASIDAEPLRRFQAALRSRTGDPRVRPTGAWDSYFNEVLRDLGAPVVANQVRIDEPFWTLSMTAPHETAEPWGAGVPLEADLHDFSAALTEGDPVHASCALPKGPLKIDIVVHRRGLEPIDGANVRVTLLQWIDPQTTNAAKWDDQTTWFSGNVPWTAAVNQVLNSADGKTALAVDSGWSFVLGNSTESHRVTLAGQTLDSMHAGIATFNLNLVDPPANQVVLLVAVIRAGTTAADDIALTPATVRDLALTKPNVAVRSMRITP